MKRALIAFWLVAAGLGVGIATATLFSQPAAACQNGDCKRP